MLETATISPECPLCGSKQFLDYRGRKDEKCKGCRSHARTRATWLLLSKYYGITANTRIAHFAPELPIAERLITTCGENYHAFDIDNDRYPFPVQYCNMCTDLGGLNQEYYDVVIHNHVIEHLPCNYTIVLQRLHALLRTGGIHIFSFPVGKGHYRSDFSPRLPSQVRKQKFGQEDHIHRFAKGDFEETVGCVFGLTNEYSLLNFLKRDILLKYGVPPARWTLELGPVFVVPKD